MIFSLALIVFSLGALFLNWYRLDHIVFDTHKWQTDISVRRDMLRADPIKTGMTVEQVRSVYGKPELEIPDTDKENTFVYLMPFSGNKAVYYVCFKKGLLVTTHIDDSASDIYEKLESEKKSN